MTSRFLRNVRLGAWLVVAGYAVWELLVESGDDWELPYTIFSVALTVAAALTFGLVNAVSRPSRTPWLRMVGLLVTGLGCVAAFVGSWAVPLWTLLLGTGFALVALASACPVRRAIACLAAAQAGGVALQLTTLQFGTEEDLAASLALLVTSGAMALGLSWGSTTSPLRPVDVPAHAHR